MSKLDGGSAFPVDMGGVQYAPGMTLRDYFAAQAISGLLSDGREGKASDMAADAYAVADALLAEREKKP